VIRIPKFLLDLPVRVLRLLLRFGRMHPGRSNIRPDLRCFLLRLLPGGLLLAHEAPQVSASSYRHYHTVYLPEVFSAIVEFV